MDAENKYPYELYFPTDKRVRYEYILQKAKKVLADQELVVRISGVRAGPGTKNPENFPSTIVELELIGIPFEHPITKQPIISWERLEEFFQSEELQRSFVTFVCHGVSSTVPDDPELRSLKHKLANVTEGRPSELPPRLDLLLLYYELIEQVVVARAKVEQIKKSRSKVDGLTERFVAGMSRDSWWVRLIRTHQMTIEGLTTGSAEAVSQMILALAFGVSEEAIRSRLFRPE